MDERLRVVPKEMESLRSAEEVLDQLAEDADSLDQPTGARVMREAAIAIRKATGRFDYGRDPEIDAYVYTLRGK